MNKTPLEIGQSLLTALSPIALQDSTGANVGNIIADIVQPSILEHVRSLLAGSDFSSTHTGDLCTGIYFHSKIGTMLCTKNGIMI